MASVNKPGVGAKEIIPPPVRLSHAPRQSTATQIRLKVIQGSVERLMGEVEELGEIKQFLVNLRNQMDEEAIALHKMTDIAFEALSCEVLMPDLEYDAKIKGQLELTDSVPNLPKKEIKQEDCKQGVKRVDSDSKSDIDGTGRPKVIKMENSQAPIKIEADDQKVFEYEVDSKPDREL